MDMMTVIYDKLMEDDYVKAQATGRIKFYVYPESGSVTSPYIVIAPLMPPLPGNHADNEPMTDDYLYQIDVWTKNRLITKELAKRVQKVMKSLRFGYFGGSVDDYDTETGIYRDARRYRAKIYTDEVKALS